MEADIRYFDTVDSTNSVIDKMAEKGAPEYTCAVAATQQKGQGRSGRSFFSPRGGNLYMSFLLRPKRDDLELITVTAGVAVVEGLKEIFGVETGIKWVNDIIYRERKVCGIVASAHNIEREDLYVVVGIGINLYECDDIPEELRGRYGTVLGRKCDLDPDTQKDDAIHLAKTIMRLFSYYRHEEQKSEALKRYRKYSVVIGRTVEYVCGEAKKTAIVKGIDDTGGIILEEKGAIRSYHDGEIRIRTKDDNLAL